MKKIIALVLSLLMLTVCFASCNGNSTNNGDVQVIKVWTNSGSTQELMKQLVNEFNETTGKKEGIKVEYEVFLNDYATVLESAAQNDQLPELLLWPGDQAKINAANKGWVVPITDMPGGDKFLEEYGDTDLLVNKEVINGKTYFVGLGYTVQGLAYNKDLFKKAGLVDENGEPTPPKTTSEFIEYAKKLTDKANNVYGIGLPLKDQGWSMLQFPSNATFGKFSENGDTKVIDYDKETYTYTDNWLKIAEFMKDVKNSGAIFPGAESLDNDTMRAQFAAGRIGMFFTSSWDVGVLTDQFPATCEWAVAPVPVYDGFERYQNVATKTSGYMFSNNAKKAPEKTMKVFEWLMGEDVTVALYEGGYYIPVREGAAEKADTSKFPVQWSQFAELAKDKMPRYAVPSLALEGEKVDDKYKYIWNDPTIDASKYIPELNKTYTDALKKGIKEGTIDKELFKIKK